MGAWMLIAASWAGELPSLASCPDAPRAGDVKWAIARTVHIRAGDGEGTGVVVTADGFVITAAHLVARGGPVTVALKDQDPVAAIVVRSSAEADVALLRIEGDAEYACMPLRTSMADVGEDVLVVGSPGGSQLSHSVAKGIVSAYREAEGWTLVQTDASINPGNSGGPIVAGTGELAGVVSFKLVGDEVEGLGFGVAASDLARALDVRWGTSTDESLKTAESLVAAQLAPGLTYPRIDYGGLPPVDVGATYEIGYKPRVQLLVWSAIGAGVGAGMILSTNAKYQNANNMAWGAYKTLVATNTAGWVVLGASVAGVGVGFAPSPKGPVVVVPTVSGRF